MRASDLQPNFVLVIGGGGSGKNYYIEHDPVLSKYHIVDVDQIKLTMDLTSAIKAIKPMLRDAFEDRINVVHPSTGSNLKGNYNKIELAKQHGYSIAIILIDTDPAEAAKRVARRAEAGGHNVKPEAIVASNQKARENFEQLKQYADAAKVIK